MALDLSADLIEAQKNSAAVVIIFSTDYCVYCEIVKREYLQPILSQPDLFGRVIVREVLIGNAISMVDFSGNKTTHSQFSSQQDAGFVPVVRFFGANGNALKADIVGTVIEEFYLAYLQAGIVLSRQSINNNDKVAVTQ